MDRGYQYYREYQDIRPLAQGIAQGLVIAGKAGYKGYTKARQYYDAYQQSQRNKILPKGKMPTMKKSVAKKFARLQTIQDSKYSQKKNGGVVTSRKKNYRVRRRKPEKQTAVIKKQVNEIKRALRADQAYHTYKQYTHSGISSSVGLCNHTHIAGSTTTRIETFLANLRFYNPAVPGTLTTADLTTGTYNRVVHIKNMYVGLKLMNNYQVPCNIKVYLCTPKGDTSIDPVTYYENGITDQVISGGDKTTPGISMTEIDDLKKQFNIKLLKDVLLDAGSSVSVAHSSGAFDYDPSLVDSHSLLFQKKFRSFTFVVRIQGVMGHDNTALEYSNLQARVDYTRFTKTEIIYDAGVNLNDIYVSDDRSASFTNGGVVTNKPMADNQAWSNS